MAVTEFIDSRDHRLFTECGVLDNFRGLVVRGQGQGLEVLGRGQGLVNWSWIALRALLYFGFLMLNVFWFRYLYDVILS